MKSPSIKRPGIETRRVQWTVAATIGCGHHVCSVCHVATPRPSDDEVVEFAKSNPGDHFMWPGDDWMPDGWEHGEPDGFMCPECVAVKTAALSKRRAAR